MQFAVVWKESVTGSVQVEATDEEDARTQFYARYVDGKAAAYGKGLSLEPDQDFVGIEDL